MFMVLRIHSLICSFIYLLIIGGQPQYGSPVPNPDYVNHGQVSNNAERRPRPAPGELLNVNQHLKFKLFCSINRSLVG